MQFEGRKEVHFILAAHSKLILRKFISKRKEDVYCANLNDSMCEIFLLTVFRCDSFAMVNIAECHKM